MKTVIVHSLITESLYMSTKSSTTTVIALETQIFEKKRNIKNVDQLNATAQIIMNIVKNMKFEIIILFIDMMQISEINRNFVELAELCSKARRFSFPKIFKRLHK